MDEEEDPVVDLKERVAEEEEEDSIISLKERMKLLFLYHWRGIIIIIAPLISALVLLPPVEPWKWCAFTLILMAIFWVTECIPLPVTSFLPIVIFPFASIMTTSEVCNCYISDAIVMFIGSLLLAYAVEQCGLHIRLALAAIRCIGYSHYKLLFSMCFITMFISMWITNTAATTMMIPIILALLNVFENQGFITVFNENPNGEEEASDMAACYFCCITFSATIGGIGTLVGTATNLAFKGLYQKSYPMEPEHLSFPKFSAFSLPYMLSMEISMYIVMICIYFGFLRPKSEVAKKAKLTPEGIAAAKESVELETAKIGKITYWEIMVIILFSLAIAMFFCRSPLIFTGWGDALEHLYQYNDPHKKLILDSTSAFFVGFLMLLLPSTLDFFKNFTAELQEDLPDKSIRSILDWKTLNSKMPYGFMFLLGAGFALSTAAKKEYTNFNGKIGEALRILDYLPALVIILFIILLTIFLTNFASNVAVCYVIAPIAMELANHTRQNPLWYCIAAGFCASFCFCVPVGTPGNLVVQSSGKVSTIQMIKAGVGPTVISIFFSLLFIGFWAPVIWPVIDMKL